MRSGCASATTSPTARSSGSPGSPAADREAVGSASCSWRASALHCPVSGPPRRSDRSAATRSPSRTRTSSEIIATTSAARRAPTRAAPSSSARASRGSAPIRAIERPRPVTVPSSVTAPSAASVARAAAIAAAGGWSSSASPAAVRAPPGGQLERERRQVGGRDLGVRVCGEVSVLGPGPQPVDRAGRFPAGPARPLLRGGAADADRHEPGEAAPVVGPRLPRETGVDHGPDPGHGEGRLGDRGRDDDPPPRTRGEGQVLLPGREPAVQRTDVGGRAAQAAYRPGHLGRSGQEDQDVALLLGQGATGGGGDVVEERGSDAAVVGPLHAVRRRTPQLGHRVQRARDRDDRCGRCPRPARGRSARPRPWRTWRPRSGRRAGSRVRRRAGPA